MIRSIRYYYSFHSAVGSTTTATVGTVLSYITTPLIDVVAKLLLLLYYTARFPAPPPQFVPFPHFVCVAHTTTTTTNIITKYFEVYFFMERISVDIQGGAPRSSTNRYYLLQSIGAMKQRP